jgi:hypothetical protein
MHSSANVIKCAKKSAVWLLKACQKWSHDAATACINEVVSLFIEQAKKKSWNGFKNATSDDQLLVSERGLANLQQLCAGNAVVKEMYGAGPMPALILRLLCLAVLSAWAPTNDVRIWISLLLRLEALSAFQAVVKPAWPVYKGRPVAPPFKWTKLWPKVKHQSRFLTIHAQHMQSFVEFVLSKRSFIEAGMISSRGASPVSLTSL